MYLWCINGRAMEKLSLNFLIFLDAQTSQAFIHSYLVNASWVVFREYWLLFMWLLVCLWIMLMSLCTCCPCRCWSLSGLGSSVWCSSETRPGQIPFFVFSNWRRRWWPGWGFLHTLPNFLYAFKSAHQRQQPDRFLAHISPLMFVSALEESNEASERRPFCWEVNGISFACIASFEKKTSCWD